MKPRKRLAISRKKRVVFFLIMFLTVVAAIELFSACVILLGFVPGFQELHDEQNRIAKFGVASDMSRDVVHPYLGWVQNPQTPGVNYDGRTIPINAMGFADTEASIQKRSEKRVIIGILGGSVAWQFSVSGERAFRDALTRSRQFREKKIVLIRLALNGHKQPQQLLTANYLLSLGAEFDYLINIDGYNEIALAVADNFDSGVNLAYPRSWHTRSLDVADPRTVSDSWSVFEAKAARQKWARRFERLSFRYSPTANLVWKLRDYSLRNAIVQLAITNRRVRSSVGRGFLRDGPKVNPISEREAITQSVMIWKRCSLQLHQLCEAGGITYLHILQPNQYVEGSKPMSAKERVECVYLEQEYGRIASLGYQDLIRTGRELSKQGVRFFDMTMLFSDETERIYDDPFCHYNKRGNNMLARSIAAAIIANE